MIRLIEILFLLQRIIRARPAVKIGEGSVEAGDHGDT